MLHKTLFDLSGTAQKDMLVNPAPCAISMCKLMTNPTRSTIIGITYFEWEKLVKVDISLIYWNWKTLSIFAH